MKFLRVHQNKHLISKYNTWKQELRKIYQVLTGNDDIFSKQNRTETKEQSQQPAKVGPVVISVFTYAVTDTRES